jgi:O-phosphoseryl-tRNA(Cys) synthetase
MIFNELNEDNFLLFAIKNYENPQAVTKEDFEKDLNHFKYIKRLLKRYKNTGQLKSHLLLNHFIILYNIFGEATTPMLFFKIEKGIVECVKNFYYIFG